MMIVLVGFYKTLLFLCRSYIYNKIHNVRAVIKLYLKKEVVWNVFMHAVYYTLLTLTNSLKVSYPVITIHTLFYGYRIENDFLLILTWQR